MIPKVIHWCWFGRGPKSALVRKCVASWKRCLSEYEIKEWNEDNFDIHCNKYVEEAYLNRKWAFVTDYVRLYALYHEGGIYMDSDVEVLRPLDNFLTLPAFIGRDSINGCGTGTIGSVRGGQLVKDLLDDYENRRFVRPDGTFDLTTNVAYTDERMTRLGLTFEDVEFEVPGYVKIFKQEVFCPKSFQDRSYCLTENSYAIHHFAATWQPLRMRAINWTKENIGYVPSRILSYLWDRPDRAMEKFWNRIVRRCK